MFNIKQVLLASATFGVVATIGAISPKSAQAAIISGEVSGIWTFENDGPGGYQVGDPFTALYTYDEADLVTQINNTNNVNSTFSSTSNSISSFSAQSKITSAKLLSLIVNSGSVQQVFSLTPSFSLPSISWSEFQDEGKENDVVVRSVSTKGTSISTGNSYEGSVTQSFQAYRGILQENGISSDYSSAVANAQDFGSIFTNGGDPSAYLLYGSTNQPVTFSSTNVPTPALLPGLIGLGLGALRKRKALPASEQAA
jgi:hypothetical protein